MIICLGVVVGYRNDYRGDKGISCRKRLDLSVQPGNRVFRIGYAKTVILFAAVILQIDFLVPVIEAVFDDVTEVLLPQRKIVLAFK